MSAATIASLVITVILVVVIAYSILGSLPLLILAHDVPQDARFVRGFFAHFYKVAVVLEGLLALCYALAGKWWLAAVAGALALLSAYLLKTLVPRLDALGADIATHGNDAIRNFRRLHGTAVLLNVAQLLLIVGSVIAVSMQLKGVHSSW